MEGSFIWAPSFRRSHRASQWEDSNEAAEAYDSFSWWQRRHRDAQHVWPAPAPIHTHTCSDLLQVTHHVGSVIFQTVPQGRKNSPLGDDSNLNHRTSGCFLHKVVTIEYILKCWPIYLFQVSLLSERHWFAVLVLPALHILPTPSPMSIVLYKCSEASLCVSLPLEPVAFGHLASVILCCKKQEPHPGGYKGPLCSHNRSMGLRQNTPLSVFSHMAMSRLGPHVCGSLGVTERNRGANWMR